MFKQVSNNLDGLFYPRSVAVIGASPKRGFGMIGGNIFIEGALKMKFGGRIYPVHPTAESILGLKAFPSIRAIPDEVDLAIFSVPFSIVIEVMEDCAAKGVKYVHLFTAGFSETGRKENAELEKKLLDVAKKGGVRVIGPNCMGVYCPEGGVSWSSDFPQTPGSVGFFSQSGQMAGDFVRGASFQGIRFSKVVSFGNASDLKANEFLRYLGQDQKTEVIGGYIEGLRDGRKFFEAAKSITPKKPLVILKGGQTEGGARATRSHTAAIAGSQEIWQSMCKQAGIIQVESMDELVYTVSALKNISLPKDTRVAILGGGGGGSVTMTDAAEREGLTVPLLSENTIRSLEEIVPLQGSSSKNPLDVMAALFNPEHFKTLIKLLRDDPNIDVLLFFQLISFVQQMMGRTGLSTFIQMTTEAKEELNKPMFLIIEQCDDIEGKVKQHDVEERYHNEKIPTFPSLQMAARVLSNMKKYNDFLSKKV